MLISICSAALAAHFGAPEKEIEALLNDYAKAATAYDVKRLEELLAPEYLEVSPIGDVDVRDKVLSFYRIPESQRGPMPSGVSISELKIRFLDKTKAVAVFREDLEITRAEKKIKMSFRFTSVVVKQGTKWKLISNHANAIRKP